MAKFRKYIRAQTAMELAVFGAILIFMVGVIVRQALSSAYMQNQNLRVMRQAMTTSYQYSMLQMGADRQASHQTTNILSIEDRLTTGSGGHAAVDRTPYVVSGSATYSRTLFYPIAWGESQQLPVYDMFINGKQLPFTTQAFRSVELARSCAGVSPCPPECKGDCNLSGAVIPECSGLSPCPLECIGDCSGPKPSLQFYPANLPCPNVYPCPAACNNDCTNTSTQVYPVAWEDNCVDVTTTLTLQCLDFCVPACGVITDPDTGISSCNTAGSWTQTQTETVGCAKLYDVIYNHPGFPEWCSGESGACPADNLTADQRFDLNHDGTTDVPAGAARDTFAWQWIEVLGWTDTAVAPSIPLPLGGGGVPAVPPISRSSTPVGAGAYISKDMHNVVDVDQDLKRETIVVDPEVGAGKKAFSVPTDFKTGVILSLPVLDRQMGDLDMTRGNSDPGPAPGLQQNVRMYSFVNGAYLLLEEGRLYAPDTGQYIRTTQKKDQVDIIERTIQLSNNTGRFCSGSTPTNTGSAWTAQVLNPVEACENCYSSANIQKTCMDRVRKVILVRSRIQDRRGRKWVTNTSGDDNVDFTVPPVP